jgi:hypothetical protein
MHVGFFSFLFFFGSTSVGTQGLTLARQVLYHLSHPSCEARL